MKIIYKEDHVHKKMYCPECGEFLGYDVSTPSYETEKCKKCKIDLQR